MSVSTSEKATINTVLEAIKKERLLMVRYMKLDGEITDRTVLPYTLPVLAKKTGNAYIKLLDGNTSDGRQESTYVINNIISAKFI